MRLLERRSPLDPHVPRCAGASGFRVALEGRGPRPKAYARLGETRRRGPWASRFLLPGVSNRLPAPVLPPRQSTRAVAAAHTPARPDPGTLGAHSTTAAPSHGRSTGARRGPKRLGRRGARGAGRTLLASGNNAGLMSAPLAPGHPVLRSEVGVLPRAPPPTSPG